MTLEERYILARWCYGIGEVYIDDIEYRGIEEALKEQGLCQEYTSRSWSDDPCPVELLKKYDLMQYYRDVTFLYRSESIRSINSETVMKSELSDISTGGRLSYKLDGWSIQLNYYNGKFLNANTRGRSGDHLKVDNLGDIVIKVIPYKGRAKITGELVVPNKAWLKLAEETGNVSQRASVRTALARDMLDCLKFVAFDIKVENDVLEGDNYTILQNLGFTVPIKMDTTSFTSLQTAIEIMGRRAKCYAYPTDGLVYEDAKRQVALRVGYWEEKVLSSYIVDYDENRGVYGDAMVAVIKPVKYSGATYSEVSVTNIRYIVENNLRIGSPIAFDIRSGVGAVLNTTKTADIQEKYKDNIAAFKEMIDGRE